MDRHQTTMQAPSPPPPRRKSADLALAATRLGGVGRGCGPRNSAGAGLGRRPKGSGRRGERRPPVDTERVDPAVRTIRSRLRRVGPCAAGRSRGRLELLSAGTDTMNSRRTRHERPNFAHRGWRSISMEHRCRCARSQVGGDATGRATASDGRSHRSSSPDSSNLAVTGWPGPRDRVATESRRPETRRCGQAGRRGRAMPVRGHVRLASHASHRAPRASRSVFQKSMVMRWIRKVMRRSGACTVRVRDSRDRRVRDASASPP